MAPNPNPNVRVTTVRSYGLGETATKVHGDGLGHVREHEGPNLSHTLTLTLTLSPTLPNLLANGPSLCYSKALAVRQPSPTWAMLVRPLHTQPHQPNQPHPRACATLILTRRASRVTGRVDFTIESMVEHHGSSVAPRIESQE